MWQAAAVGLLQVQCSVACEIDRLTHHATTRWSPALGRGSCQYACRRGTLPATPIASPDLSVGCVITFVQVWNTEGDGRKLGILVRTLVGHSHRVNTLALSCEAALRTGPFGKEDCALRAMSNSTPAEVAQAAAQERYDRAR